MIRKSKPHFLLFAFLALVIGISQASVETSGIFGLGQALMATFLIILGVLLGFVYLFTRRKLISIASKGGESILASAGGLSHDLILGFLSAVELEKLRVFEVASRVSKATESV